MGKQTRVDIIIPTRNEQENIGKLIGEIRKVSPEYNIIVVDDSDDEQTKAASILANVNDYVYGQHKGLGQAIIDGIKISNGDISVVMDADFSHPPSKIPELIKACVGGMAVGSRYVDGGKITGWSLKRRLISLVASSMAYPITGIRDNTSGFFAVDKAKLNGAELNADSWKIMLEVLVKSKMRVTEVPIEFKDRTAGKSKYNRKEIIAYLNHLIKLAMYKWRILNFGLVGGTGYVVNMVVYYPLTLLFENTTTLFGQEFYLPPFLISSYVAITHNYFLNKISTFKDYTKKSMSYLKYLLTCSASLPVEMLLIYLLVKYLGLIPIIAVAVSILIVFIARYAIVSRIVWSKVRQK